MGLDLASHGAAKAPSKPASVWSSVSAKPQRDGLGSLAEALDRILTKGVTVDGAVTIGVAGVDLVLLDLRLLLAAVDTVGGQGSMFSAAPAGSAPPNRPPPAAPSDGRGGSIAFPPPPRLIGPNPGGHAASVVANEVANEVASEVESDVGGLLQAGQMDSGRTPDAELGGRKGPQHGLMKLVLTLVNLLHEVLERQAVRRMGNGTLTSQQIEDLGVALHAQAMEIARLREQFGLSETDLALRLSASH